MCQVGRALERDRLKTLVFDFWSTVVGVVSNPAPDIVEYVRLKSSLNERNFAGTKWLVLQNIISSDGSSCQHRIFPEMSSQNSYSDITTRVAITRGENFSLHLRKLACKLVANALFAGVCQICTRANLELVLGGKPIAKAVVANYANYCKPLCNYSNLQKVFIASKPIEGF